MKQGENDYDPTHVFPHRTINYEDEDESAKLALPILDSFLTRYIYHSFARWFDRFSKFIGIKEDI